jgi:hypothetical protein
MNKIIYVDFKIKQIVDTTSTRKWICLVCKKIFHYDVSRLDNVPYISVQLATKQKCEQGICKDCAKTVHDFVVQESW